MTKLAIILLTSAAFALTACGAESKPAADSAKPATVETSATPTTEPVADGPQPPSMTRSQIVKGLGLAKSKDIAWGEWTYTTASGKTCGVEQILLGQEQVSMYAEAGDSVPNNGDAGLVLISDPYGKADDGGYAVEKACYDELSTKMATMIGG